MADKNAKVRQPVIDMQNVATGYDNNDDVLSNIYLTLMPGSFTFVTGRSGAGKTTLMSMLYLMKKPTKGIITIFGNNVNFSNRDRLAEMRQKIGVVFQDFRLLTHLTVYDNIALPLRIRGIGEREIKKRVMELLNWVGLQQTAYRICNTLSGGEQQCVAIARAVINRPEILLADEPTGSIDAEMGHKLMKLLIELNKVGTTIIISTHNEQLTAEYNFPRIHLENGTVKLYPALGRIKHEA